MLMAGDATDVLNACCAGAPQNACVHWTSDSPHCEAVVGVCTRARVYNKRYRRSTSTYRLRREFVKAGPAKVHVQPLRQPRHRPECLHRQCQRLPVVRTCLVVVGATVVREGVSARSTQPISLAVMQCVLCESIALNQLIGKSWSSLHEVVALLVLRQA